MKRNWLVAVIIGAGLTAGPMTTTWAVDEQGQAEKKAKVTPEEVFVEKAAAKGMAEVKMGQLAKEKAASEKVKEFGEMMVEEHSKSQRELKRLAEKKQIPLPKRTAEPDETTYLQLKKLEGPEFDKAYSQKMVKDHEQAVAEYQKAAQELKDEELKKYAEKKLPVLQKHLEEAKELAGKPDDAQ